ncbi:MAG TPA: LppX_LprAFG lipoprotein [Amycolatopsis sp.]|uniref:LppX_LprAFG lipoprotein n=1 Tax=Amycolatopsis sp. TaxID=37632 RepID=UPI002B48C1CF|nr:LppX_LprAFG lipoprotein [Amycolatopsis sp.]HKS43742.1 LppX_LprAFG lipoprotein [Amycolatopsis sp.]
MLRRTAGVLLLTVALAACDSSPDTSGPLPDGTGLVAAARSSIDAWHSVRFDFTVSGTIPGLDVRDVKGQASRDGRASGQADVQQSTNRFQLTFLMDSSTLYLTDQHGARKQEPLPADYNPVLLLGSARGLPRLLGDATGLKTETREDVKGVETYRVTGELARDVVSTVLPQIQSDVDVKFWVTQREPRELVRVWMQVPPRQPNEGAVMLELALSDVNAPMTTAPPG